jgi:hypothetical protein
VDETRNVEVVVIPPDGVGRVLLAGAATVVVRELVRATPELGDWGYRVVVGSSDRGEAELADLDEEASHLVPSGDDLVDGVLHAIARERSVYDDAVLFAAFRVEDLNVQDLDSLPAGEREAALRQATALAGCLVQAAEVVIDYLFQDIEDLRTTPEDGSFDVTRSMVLGALPARFSGRYTALFAQQFLVALVDVTSRLTKAWAPLACVAQELGRQAGGQHRHEARRPERTPRHHPLARYR